MRFNLRAGLIVMVILLTGCHDDPPDATTMAVLAALTAVDALAPRRMKAGVFFSYYVKKRIM